MAERLDIYRNALRHLGQQRITSLIEPGPSTRALDDVWQQSVELLLAKGLWNFALRAVELLPDLNVEPRFGFDYAYQKPDDWVRTAGMGGDWNFGWLPEQYRDEGGYWFADTDTLCARYISKDEEWGFNVGAWGQPFAKAVAAYIAFECALPINNDKGDRNSLFNLYERLLKDAKTLDAVDQATQGTVTGRLVRSRGGGPRYRGTLGWVR